MNVSGAGLPAGLSINASTGLISATPTTEGTYTVIVIVIAKDATGPTGSTSFRSIRRDRRLRQARPEDRQPRLRVRLGVLVRLARGSR